MSTTQPKDPMTLEKTIKSLETLRLHECGSSNRAVAALYDAAIHHLEAGRKVCECKSFPAAIMHDMIQIRMNTPSIGGCYIQFCPWCGGKVPSTIRPTEEVKG